MFKVEKINNKLFVTDYYGKTYELEETFPIELWDCPEAFKSANLKGYEPMLAKELDTEEAQDKAFNDVDYFIEEKFDGTRALVHFIKQGDESYCRVFSRRISNKTGFYVENTDSLPQIKELKVPDLDKTILDGEMFIDGLPFKEVSSTLNCLWDRAVERQIEKGFITFHAFDILFYKGIDLRKMPLYRRKVYLHLAIEEANCPYITEVKYYNCGNPMPFTSQEYINEIGRKADVLDESSYPNLARCVENNELLTPRAFYELIVATGGEGVIVKPRTGKYNHKRGWEYSKIKKFLTRELVIVGFSEPTKEYTGKSLKSWGYWVNEKTNAKSNRKVDDNYIPVTKHYYFNQIGNILLGVYVTREEFESIPPNKRGRVVEQYGDEACLMEVCECSGFDEEVREYLTTNRQAMKGVVVEVKANEIMRDSGRLRHPRFLRFRNDKSPHSCTWSDHIS